MAPVKWKATALSTHATDLLKKTGYLDKFQEALNVRRPTYTGHNSELAFGDVLSCNKAADGSLVVDCETVDYNTATDLQRYIIDQLKNGNYNAVSIKANFLSSDMRSPFNGTMEVMQSKDNAIDNGWVTLQRYVRTLDPVKTRISIQEVSLMDKPSIPDCQVLNVSAAGSTLGNSPFEDSFYIQNENAVILNLYSVSAGGSDMSAPAPPAAPSAPSAPAAPAAAGAAAQSGASAQAQSGAPPLTQQGLNPLFNPGAVQHQQQQQSQQSQQQQPGTNTPSTPAGQSTLPTKIDSPLLRQAQQMVSVLPPEKAEALLQDVGLHVQASLDMQKEAETKYAALQSQYEALKAKEEARSQSSKQKIDSKVNQIRAVVKGLPTEKHFEGMLSVALESKNPEAAIKSIHGALFPKAVPNAAEQQQAQQQAQQQLPAVAAGGSHMMQTDGQLMNHLKHARPDTAQSAQMDEPSKRMNSNIDLSKFGFNAADSYVLHMTRAQWKGQIPPGTVPV